MSRKPGERNWEDLLPSNNFPPCIEDAIIANSISRDDLQIMIRRRGVQKQAVYDFCDWLNLIYDCEIEIVSHFGDSTRIIIPNTAHRTLSGVTVGARLYKIAWEQYPRF